MICLAAIVQFTLRTWQHIYGNSPAFLENGLIPAEGGCDGNEPGGATPDRGGGGGGGERPVIGGSF